MERKYPGQKTSSYRGGYSEKIDSGWDRQTGDWSRDKLDSDRRTWTQITHRKVSSTGSGVSFEGPVNRPNASNITPVILPDGTQEYIAYLQPGAVPSDRYIKGKPDVIPFSENTHLVQEYSLDYVIPIEVLQTDLMDYILGTKSDPWGRTTVTSGQVAYDNETYMATQNWDHPDNATLQGVGPTLQEGATPARRGFIIEKSEGTLVGYNRFDTLTYGKVLKPGLFLSRFGADVESGYFPVIESTDHVEARLAASCYTVRFPYEYNTTRMDVTKEGFVSLEIGATLPKKNVGIGNGIYEHPHGSGRSLEAHLVGSLKAVIGKNKDEEEAIDLQALGQVVLRLGADDTILPNARRIVQTQIRGQGDKLSDRALQYWQNGTLTGLGDSGVATDGTGKTKGENVSLRAAFDGSAVIRLGARNPNALRRHLINGYSDGQGKIPYGINDSGRKDSHSAGRPNYGGGDSIYRFHDLTQVGTPQLSPLLPPYQSSGQPVSNMDAHGLSLDCHAVQDILLRAGANTASGQSMLIDLAGGLVVALGKDKQGRSITGAFDGGVEITINPNTQGRALRLEIDGDIDVAHHGNLNWVSTGDWTTEQTTWRNISMTDRIFTQQKTIEMSLARHTIETPDMIHNEGTQIPAVDDLGNPTENT